MNMTLHIKTRNGTKPVAASFKQGIKIFYSFVNLSFSLLTHSKANHPNIVKLLGNINLKDGKWIIPLEFIFGEDLETTIFKASKSKIQVKF